VASSRPVPGTAERGARRSRLDSLTGLRFLAALAVFANHAGDVFMGASDAYGAEALQRGGRVGVSFFFILSGFVLTWSGSGDVGARLFYRRRIARVVPNHLATWLTAMVLGITGLAAVDTELPGAAFSFLLLQSWHPSGDVHFAVNSVSWSISSEMFFYATFPFLLPLVTLIPTRARVAVCGAVAAAIVLAAVLTEAFVPGRAMWLLYIFPPARLGEFLLGIVVALLVIDGRWPDIGLRAAAIFSAVAWLSLPLVPVALHFVGVTVVPFAFLIAAVARRDAEGSGTWLRHRALVRLGVWSYAFYLVHELVLRTADHHLPLAALAPPAALAAAAVLLVAAVAASAALFATVERPVERRVRGTVRSTADA
jgi:peptidoglycan/LPS O-acetylase OafA/YrhL